MLSYFNLKKISLITVIFIISMLGGLGISHGATVKPQTNNTTYTSSDYYPKQPIIPGDDIYISFSCSALNCTLRINDSLSIGATIVGTSWNYWKFHINSNISTNDKLNLTVTTSSSSGTNGLSVQYIELHRGEAVLYDDELNSGFVFETNTGTIPPPPYPNHSYDFNRLLYYNHSEDDYMLLAGVTILYATGEHNIHNFDNPTPEDIIEAHIIAPQITIDAGASIDICELFGGLPPIYEGQRIIIKTKYIQNEKVYYSSFVQAGLPDLFSTPRDVSAQSGDSYVSVPVDITADWAALHATDTFDITVTYNSEVVIPSDEPFNLTSTLLDGWNMTYSVLPNILKITAHATSDAAFIFPTILDTSPVPFIDLQFDVVGQPDQMCDIDVHIDNISVPVTVNPAVFSVTAPEKGEEGERDDQIKLFNSPNPFNPITEIRFSTQNPNPVNLNIYNLQGQFVKNLINKEMESGNYSVIWDGTTDNGTKVSSGVYVYTLDVGNNHLTKRMILLK